jgi:chemotaxis signal transduction protein
MKAQTAYDRSRGGIQLVTFRLGAERFGISVSKVREILRPIDLFPVPGMGAGVEGVINLRGEIIPVVKMASLIGVVKNAGEQLPHRRRIVIIDASAGSFGFFVDEVFEVTRVKTEEVQAPPDLGHGGAHASAVVTAIVKIGGRMVVCIDPERIITDDLMAKEPAIGG